MCFSQGGRNGIASREKKRTEKATTEPAFCEIAKKGTGLGREAAEVCKRSDCGELHLEHKRPRRLENDERASLLLAANVL